MLAHNGIFIRVTAVDDGPCRRSRCPPLADSEPNTQIQSANEALKFPVIVAPPQPLTDGHNGIAAQVAATRYDGPEAVAVGQPSPWAAALARYLAAFRDLLAKTALPAAVVAQMWGHAISLAQVRPGF